MKREFETLIDVAEEFRSTTKSDGFGGSERALSTFLTDHHGANDMKLLIISGDSDVIYAYTNAMPVLLYTNRIALIRPNYLTDQEFSGWVDEVVQSDFDYVINYSPEPGKDDAVAQNNRLGKAVNSITQVLDRIDYPSDRLAVYQRQL